MIDLLATAPDDGWAFVRHNGKIQLVRPPYQRWSLVDVDESVVEKAVKDHGFTAEKEGMIFSGWDQLIAHLKQQVVATRKEQGHRVPQAATIRGLIHKAPRRVLAQYLEKVESELLPNKEWPAALDLLSEMLIVDAVKQDEDLYKKTIELLRSTQRRLSDERMKKHELVDEEALWKEKWRRASGIYGVSELLEYGRSMIQRGQFFAPAAAV